MYHPELTKLNIYLNCIAVLFAGNVLGEAEAREELVTDSQFLILSVVPRINYWY